MFNRLSERKTVERERRREKSILKKDRIMPSSDRIPSPSKPRFARYASSTLTLSISLGVSSFSLTLTSSLVYSLWHVMMPPS